MTTHPAMVCNMPWPLTLGFAGRTLDTKDSISIGRAAVAKFSADVEGLRVVPIRVMK